MPCCSAKLNSYNMLTQRILRLVSPHYSLARGIYNISQARSAAHVAIPLSCEDPL